MFNAIIAASVRFRWFVVIAVVLVAGLGLLELTKLPIDAVPDIFQAMAAGEANATVELTPNMAGPAFDALEAYWKNGTVPPKFIQTESKLYTQADDPQAVYESKKDLGY